MDTIQKVNDYISKQRQMLLTHSLYNKIKEAKHLRVFVEHHVYAVWDFMSLLKALQQKLTCVSTPWFASDAPQTRYLINEIVLAEESDIALDGRRLSHYEMYYEAMKACGASTIVLDRFIENVKTSDVFTAIENADFHPHVKSFLNFSFETIKNGKTHEIAAAFTFGREDLIPSMFTAILKELKSKFSENQLNQLTYYFERHIELDADEHGPMAFEMIQELCGDDEKKWQEVADISKLALEKRILLWNAIEESLEK